MRSDDTGAVVDASDYSTTRDNGDEGTPLLVPFACKLESLSARLLLGTEDERQSTLRRGWWVFEEAARGKTIRDLCCSALFSIDISVTNSGEVLVPAKNLKSLLQDVDSEIVPSNSGFRSSPTLRFRQSTLIDEVINIPLAYFYFQMQGVGILPSTPLSVLCSVAHHPGKLELVFDFRRYISCQRRKSSLPQHTALSSVRPSEAKSLTDSRVNPDISLTSQYFMSAPKMAVGEGSRKNAPDQGRASSPVAVPTVLTPLGPLRKRRASPVSAFASAVPVATKNHDEQLDYQPVFGEIRPHSTSAIPAAGVSSRVLPQAAGDASTSVANASKNTREGTTTTTPSVGGNPTAGLVASDTVHPAAQMFWPQTPPLQFYAGYPNYAWPSTTHVLPSGEVVSSRVFLPPLIPLGMGGAGLPVGGLAPSIMGDWPAPWMATTASSGQFHLSSDGAPMTVIIPGHPSKFRRVKSGAEGKRSRPESKNTKEAATKSENDGHKETLTEKRTGEVQASYVTNDGIVSVVNEHSTAVIPTPTEIVSKDADKAKKDVGSGIHDERFRHKGEMIPTGQRITRGDSAKMETEEDNNREGPRKPRNIINLSSLSFGGALSTGSDKAAAPEGARRARKRKMPSPTSSSSSSSSSSSDSSSSSSASGSESSQTSSTKGINSINTVPQCSDHSIAAIHPPAFLTLRPGRQIKVLYILRNDTGREEFLHAGRSSEAKTMTAIGSFVAFTKLRYDSFLVLKRRPELEIISIEVDDILQVWEIYDHKNLLEVFNRAKAFGTLEKSSGGEGFSTDCPGSSMSGNIVIDISEDEVRLMDDSSWRLAKLPRLSDTGGYFSHPVLGSRVIIPEVMRSNLLEVNKWIEAQLKEKQKAVVRQADYYFSPANFRSDTFLKSAEKNHLPGGIPISFIAKFNAMQQITQSVQFIAQSLEAASRDDASRPSSSSSPLPPLLNFSAADGVVRRTWEDPSYASTQASRRRSRPQDEQVALSRSLTGNIISTEASAAPAFKTPGHIEVSDSTRATGDAFQVPLTPMSQNPLLDDDQENSLPPNQERQTLQGQLPKLPSSATDLAATDPASNQPAMMVADAVKLPHSSTLSESETLGLAGRNTQMSNDSIQGLNRVTDSDFEPSDSAATGEELKLVGPTTAESERKTKDVTKPAEPFASSNASLASLLSSHRSCPAIRHEKLLPRDTPPTQEEFDSNLQLMIQMGMLPTNNLKRLQQLTNNHTRKSRL